MKPASVTILGGLILASTILAAVVCNYVDYQAAAVPLLLTAFIGSIIVATGAFIAIWKLHVSSE